MYFERIIDINTGEETIRPYTEEEIAETKKNELEHKKLLKEIEKRELMRQSAMTKLLALGLTEDEIAAL